LDHLQAQLTAFELACRKAGLKATHQRLEIYRELLQATDHPTADTLYQRLRLKLPTLSLDTVYRTLATLANRGLISKVETAESLARFEVPRIRHHHLICRKCGEIMDFVWSLLDEAPLPGEIMSWGKIDHKSLVVYGTCNRCMK
jgi:Fur family transcriptional regulator, peroxide stress response regulator